MDCFGFLLSAGSNLKLDDLLPNTSYLFNIRASNAVGAGNSISVPVTTLPPRKYFVYLCHLNSADFEAYVAKYCKLGNDIVLASSLC